MKLPSFVAALAIPLLASSLLHAETPAEKETRMKWFNDARFGLFIHWGVYSAAAGNFDGKPVPGAGEWLQNGGKIPAAEYRAKLQGAFNPVKYDPESWVVAAKNAGMKYIVITSKHHDGFCLWDSKLTDWDVGSTPHKKDLLKPLADACKKHGLKFCLYHSIMDWGHPDYGTKAPWRANADNPSPDMDAYTEYMNGQLKELIDNYQPGILWFDGEWEAAWTHERGVALYESLRKLDPALIINNRVDKGRRGMEGNTSDSKFKGDYGTPEQQIPATGFGDGVSWESCMTMNGTWGFKTSDTKWKSAETLVRNLIDIASKGGNYLLNVGPTGEGEIPAASLERLAAMGDWMETNGESIHGTTASLFPKVSWDGRSTTRISPDGSTRVYLHVFGRPDDGKINIRGLMTRPDHISILGQDQSPTLSGNPGEWILELPGSASDPIATVVAMDFKATPKIEVPVAKPDAKGVMKLNPADAKLHGTKIKIETITGKAHIGFWTNPADSISWKVALPEGKYRVSIIGACETKGSGMKLTAGTSETPFSFPGTGSWKTFQSSDVGIMTIPSGGASEVKLEAVSGTGTGFLNVRGITFSKQL